MPRPKGGYFIDGEAVPGTNDPISRYMDQEGLKRWFYANGKKGLPMYGTGDIDIGSAVHAMAELDLKGRPDREIEAEAHQRLGAAEHLQKAFNCFRAFRNWREECKVRAVALETSLVSRRYRYGGTPDWILAFGSMNGALGLMDGKSSAKCQAYPNMVVALAAHANLWEETHPDMPLRAGKHLLMLPKEGGNPRHIPYSDTTLEWEIFKRYLELFRLEKEGLAFLNQSYAQVKNGAATADLVKKYKAPPERKPSPKLEHRPNLSMAELLRLYGHIKEGVGA